MREEVKKQASLKSLDQEEFKGKGNSEEKTLKGEEIKKKKGEFQEEKLLKIKQNSQNEETGKKPTSPHFLSLEEKENLVKKVEGCSTRATEKIAFRSRSLSLCFKKRACPFFRKRARWK